MAVIISVTTVFAAGVTSFAEENLYLKQLESGKCTLASVAMMMRSKAKMEGNSTWVNITQEAIRSTAWIEGQGLRHSFTYHGTVVGYGEIKSSDKKAALLSLLERYPEGVEIYIRELPHAVFLTRYDASTDKFYCADPGLSATEMKLEDSWMRKVYVEPSTVVVPEESEVDDSEVTEGETGDVAAPETSQPALPVSVQQQIIDTVDAYWYISSYKKADFPVYVDPSEEPKVEEPETDEPVVSNPPSGNTVKFDRVKTYKSSIFKDIPSYEWYVTSVKGAYEMNLMNGMTSNTFEPNGNMSMGQAITLAARIYSTYMGESPDFTAKGDEMWYMPYVRYAYQNGVISSKYYNLGYADFDKDVLRVQFAEIFSGALPENALPQINDVEDGDIPDIMLSSPGGKSVYKLYRAGILTGDTDGFKPYSKITRCQVAAIATRMADSELRVKF